MGETKTISLDGSDELYWEDVDKYARRKGFKTTAGFIQYLLEREMFGFKTKIKDILTYIIIMMLFVIILLLFIVR